MTVTIYSNAAVTAAYASTRYTAEVNGETAPVLFTGAAFYLPLLPSSVGDQTMALSMHVFALVTQVPNVPESMKYGTALVLLGVVLAFNSVAIVLRAYLRRNRRW